MNGSRVLFDLFGSSGSNIAAMNAEIIESKLESQILQQAEVTETVGPVSFRGRIVVHVLSSLVLDIFPNYSYNMYTQRFVKAPIPKERMHRPKPPGLGGAEPANLGFGKRCGKK